MRDDVGHGFQVARADDADLAWASDRIAVSRWPDDTQGMAVFKSGVRKAVILYNMFMGRGCMAHIVSDESRAWASRGVLYALFGYPFLQLDLDRMMITTPADNVPALVMNLKLGFEIEARIRDTAEHGGDEIMFTMRRDACRWIRMDCHE